MLETQVLSRRLNLGLPTGGLRCWGWVAAYLGLTPVADTGVAEVAGCPVVGVTVAAYYILY